MNRLVRRLSPWLNPLRKRNSSNLHNFAKKESNAYVTYVEKKFPHLVLSDKSIVLFESRLEKVFRQFYSKYMAVKLVAIFFPFITVYYSTLEYERIEMYAALEDWVKQSPRNHGEGWSKINEATVLFTKLTIISFIVAYILKERLLIRSGRFVTHSLFNYEEKSLIFRTSDFRQIKVKYLKVPVDKVKWECKEGYAPPPTFDILKKSEGSMYGNTYGFSNVNVTFPKEETEETHPDSSISDDPHQKMKKQVDHKANADYRYLNLMLRGLPGGNRGKEDQIEKLFIMNGSHADESAFNEFITKMDITGDPQIIIQQPDTRWHGLTNQTNLDGFTNKNN